MITRLKRFDYSIVLIIAFTYYALLYSHAWNWLMAGQDSGDWLAGSTIWMNVQPYGSPLYVLLGHLVNLFSTDLPADMTLFLSVVPASITVATVYMIAKKLTSTKFAIVSALVLLGAAIPLSQATILEEYAISSMFLTLGVWFYINDRKSLTILMLALGSAVHIIVAIICVFFLALHLKEIKLWYKQFWIYFVFGILPYSLVFILMYLDTPRLLSASLSWAGINNYLGSTSTIGAISWFEFLYRIPQSVGILTVSLGFALIPLFVGLKKPFTKIVWVMIVIVFFSLWLYLTDTDSSTWTFMNFCFPMIAVLVAIGLQNMKPIHTKVVACCAIVLILVNSVGLNANLLNKENPLATNYEQAVRELPSGAGVVIFSGGQYGLGTMYLMAKGVDVVPIFYSDEKPEMDRHLESARYQDYRKWLAKKYNVQGDKTVTMVQDMLDQNRPVYLLMQNVTPYWENVFQVEYSITMPADSFQSKQMFFAEIVGIR